MNDENTSITGRLHAAPDLHGAVRPVLVTGGGGFLGGHIVRKLLARGDAVRTFGRRKYPELAALGVDCRRGDLADAGAVKGAVKGCRAVIHAGALPGVGGRYQEYYNANYLGASHILDAALACGVRKLVYTSTPSVVHGGASIEGGDESLPFPEHYHNPYAETKAMAEKLILAANSPSFSFATIALRPHLIFGPGDTQLIPKLLKRARKGGLARIGNGRNLISVSYVENVADAHLLALDKLRPDGPMAGKAYFVNEPEPVNCWDFINRIVEGAGLPRIRRSVPYTVAYAAGWMCEKLHVFLRRAGDPRVSRFLANQLATSHWFRVDAIRRDLGWEPRVPLEEGIQRMLEDVKLRGL